ncbi:glyoxal oxidase [Moniliophthora roreri MCA 2997]|uniref:Glyoxal oxidase n=1 Tax=Moniliophthora roreri (strain MCA 2997) TaxID=1381753 RepID=V2WXJ5_MONRO|nr:glyoxal oxidase [Moniliophthora roreri MCA 2997]
MYLSPHDQSSNRTNDTRPDEKIKVRRSSASANYHIEHRGVMESILSLPFWPFDARRIAGITIFKIIRSFSQPSPFASFVPYWLHKLLYSLYDFECNDGASPTFRTSPSLTSLELVVGNDGKVYILDKAESKAAQINGHPAWGAVWDINTHQVELMDVKTNAFCAAGMYLPNGSFVTFGENKAIGPGDSKSSDGKDLLDDRLGVSSGRKAIRVRNPCTSSDGFDSSDCQWSDNPPALFMQMERWYAAAGPLGDGSIVLIGGFTNGGYINRNTLNDDPMRSGGGTEPNFEFFPPSGREGRDMQFMGKTSGLNSMLLWKDVSPVPWNPQNNTETDLPDMPDRNPKILFCGGSDLPDEAWDNYSFPNVNTWEHPSSKDCQRPTPEPIDGSTPKYERDDDMIEGRTMG